jgi:hypothetical protein
MRWSIAQDAPGSHVMCYCADCQSHARHLGRTDMLDQGGSDIFQTIPSAFRIDAGQEHLAMQRLGPRGMYRWYAGCCNTPIANTLNKNSLPFVGAVLPPGAQGFGKITAIANTQSAPIKIRQRGLFGAVWSLLTRAILAKLRGQTASPFFNAEGGPVIEGRVLTKEERKAARP